VVITFKMLAGANSVVSGIFFDPPSAQAAAQSELSNVKGSRAGEISGTANNVTKRPMLDQALSRRNPTSLSALRAPIGVNVARD
jgi:hypothetical protein